MQFLLPRVARAEDSPRLAQRGMEAYRSGHYDLARLFFSKALQDAVLKGKEEWVAKASLNLVDLELEAMNEAAACKLLDGLVFREPGLRSLVLWKRSQLAFLQRHNAQALDWVDSALAIAPAGKSKTADDVRRFSAMRMDRFRYLAQARDPSEWSKEYEAFRKRLGPGEPGRFASLDAAVRMARRDFPGADSLWRLAEAYYRDRGNLAQAAACLNQSALCLFAQGRREEAQQANARAIGIYGELGLAIPGLRAQALRLLLLEDGLELAKLKRDMDLLGQRFSGFDLQGILDEYSHSLRDGLLGPRPQ